MNAHVSPVIKGTMGREEHLKMKLRVKEGLGMGRGGDERKAKRNQAGERAHTSTRNAIHPPCTIPLILSMSTSVAWVSSNPTERSRGGGRTRRNDQLGDNRASLPSSFAFWQRCVG